MEDEVLYDFATKMFRNVADSDYITARLCYRNNLSIQFLWMAQQSIEKYLKAILLYNKRKATKIGHNLIKAIEEIEEINSFNFKLSDESMEFINHINTFGNNRYLSIYLLSTGDLLRGLDNAVFELRLYCKAIPKNHKIDKPDNSCNSNDEVKGISHSKDPNCFRLDGGFLEEVIDNANDRRREALVWCNVRYGHPLEDIDTKKMPFQFMTPPSIKHKEHFDEIKKYIKFGIEETNYINDVIRNSKN